MPLFDGFYGNSKAKEALVFYQRDGRFPHGILLEGEEGTGRRKTAVRSVPPLQKNPKGDSPGRADNRAGAGKKIL